ncbi:MAG TPA: hypothetical protein VKB93_17640 [Thermoanaerobaculia bacterium]|nr:hypothetical protein [Thermoanaerobaculia bacterium]
MNQKLDELKSRGLEKLHNAQCNVETSMRTSPMKWAGIAAGTGLGLGIAGRIARGRSKRSRALPELVIIDSRC